MLFCSTLQQELCGRNQTMECYVLSVYTIRIKLNGSRLIILNSTILKCISPKEYSLVTSLFSMNQHKLLVLELHQRYFHKFSQVCLVKRKADLMQYAAKCISKKYLTLKKSNDR